VTLWQPMSIGPRTSCVGVAIAVASICAGCGGDTQLTVRYAPEYVPSNGSLSVFGVFENGRLSSDAWREVGPILSSGFSQSVCESAWNENFLNANPTLTSAIDEYTRDDGVSDKLLARLAPLAKGGSILTFTVLGRRPASKSEGSARAKGSTSSAPLQVGGGMSGMGGGGRGMRGGGGRRQPSMLVEQDSETKRGAYEISALLYSIQQRRSIASVSMSYTGPDIDVALKEFSDKLRTAITNVTCAGWDFDAKVDAGKIRELMDQPVPEAVTE